MRRRLLEWGDRAIYSFREFTALSHAQYRSTWFEFDSIAQ
jgi:hypothetical protein